MFAGRVTGSTLPSRVSLRVNHACEDGQHGSEGICQECSVAAAKFKGHDAHTHLHVELSTAEAVAALKLNSATNCL
jgi:hypothetical protein